MGAVVAYARQRDMTLLHWKVRGGLLNKDATPMSTTDNVSPLQFGESLPGQTGTPKAPFGIDVNDPAATGYLTNHSVAELGQATKDSKAAIDGKH